MSETADSEGECSTNNRQVSTPKKRKAQRGSDLATNEKPGHRLQLFRQEWREKDEFKLWLKPTDDRTRAYCSLCKKDFVAELTVIKNHAGGKKHCQYVKDSQPRSVRLMRQFATREHKDEDEPVKKAEIKMAGFLAAHNISFNTMDHLSDLIKECCPDSDIAKKNRMKRTKSKLVVTNVIAKTQKEWLILKLKERKFSILIDESTDIACLKCACIIVRFYNQESGVIESKFWELVQVFSADDAEGAEAGATAERLFIIVVDTFRNEDIPLDNIIGFASDNCNTMMGVNNSVASRFRELCPNIVIIGCICHSLHLCASSACKELPRKPEDLARNEYAFFQFSAKRKAEFAQFQKFLDLDVHKILHPSQTRWLSLAAVVQRMLEQWDALRLYFDEKWLNHQLRNSEVIHTVLNDPSVKGYYLFLEWVLPKITTMNAYFQSDKTGITNVYDKIKLAYKELLLTYCGTSYVNSADLSDINPNLPADSSHLLPLNAMYLGVSMINHLSKPDIAPRIDMIQEIQLNCRNFLMKLCAEIRSRFNFKDPVFTQIAALDTKKALSKTYREEVLTLVHFMQTMSRCVGSLSTQQIDDQWRRLPECQESLPPEIVATESPDAFWHQLLHNNEEENGGVLDFRSLAEFALAALSIPHSNAECERTFSKINSVKTKCRNRLITSTISGIVLANQAVKSAGCCTKFQPCKKMLDRMTKDGVYGVAQINVADPDEEDIIF